MSPGLKIGGGHPLCSRIQRRTNKDYSRECFIPQRVCPLPVHVFLFFLLPRIPEGCQAPSPALVEPPAPKAVTGLPGWACTHHLRMCTRVHSTGWHFISPKQFPFTNGRRVRATLPFQEALHNWFSAGLEGRPAIRTGKHSRLNRQGRYSVPYRGAVVSGRALTYPVWEHHMSLRIFKSNQPPDCHAASSQEGWGNRSNCLQQMCCSFLHRHRVPAAHGSMETERRGCVHHVSSRSIQFSPEAEWPPPMLWWVNPKSYFLSNRPE
ncbi:uncharacterized protein LOC104848644 isoform X2 [Fukomys damarensis]|uniref:uncharacterized protein LOC104848644 isoform X2 n=1 Tax=Fukomys damarensis TaxID=885580 RepID=UPI0008FF734F|nr:uncharacterized protein LOC104848644 isoform X2 [Fukomys damarensis]